MGALVGISILTEQSGRLGGAAWSVGVGDVLPARPAAVVTVIFCNGNSTIRVLSIHLSSLRLARSYERPSGPGDEPTGCPRSGRPPGAAACPVVSLDVVIWSARWLQLEPGALAVFPRREGTPNSTFAAAFLQRQQYY